MDAFPSVQTSRLQDPNVAASEMALWHDKGLVRFELELSCGTFLGFAKDTLGLLKISKSQ